MEVSAFPEVTFKVHKFNLSGKLYLPKGNGPFPALLIYHGYKGCRQQYGLFARDLTSMGIAVFAFNFRGCGRGRSWSEGDITQQTIADHGEDALAAYDYLLTQKNIDLQRIACFGSSLGGYLAACTSAQRQFTSLILSAPAIYADQWAQRVIGDIPESELHEYRQTADLQKTEALQSMTKFRGSVLVIRHENDHQVPERVSQSYFETAQLASHRELKVLEGAGHQLTEATRQTRQEWIKDWLKQTL